MMEDIADLKNLSGDAHSRLGQPRLGVISSSDWRTASAKVILQPEGVLTGWLPVLTQWTGSGWGLACPPSPGDQVLVIPREGNITCGLIVGRLYSNLVRPPQAEPGEFVIRHESGSAIRLLNSGNVMIEGDLHVSGQIYDSHGSLNRLRSNYNIHTHPTNNGGVTSIPIVQDKQP